jgi:Zn-dependent protease
MDTAITILSFVVLMLSVIAHEVAHGYAANSLGDPTARLAGRLTLNPIPHIDLVGSILLPASLMLTHSPIFFGWAKPVPYNPHNLRDQRWGETIVALAGVATNFVLALIFGLLVRFGPSIGLGQSEVAFAGTISFINLFLCLFNLIPFPPFDGFTALRSALPWRYSAELYRFENNVRAAGIAPLLLFLFFFSYILAAPFSDFVYWVFHLIAIG